VARRSDRTRGARRPAIPDASSGKPAELRLIANLLGLLVVKGEPRGKQVSTLVAAGFSVGEAAELLRIRQNTASAALYRERQEQDSRQ
jgi:hypothetical protein